MANKKNVKINFSEHPVRCISAFIFAAGLIVLGIYLAAAVNAGGMFIAWAMALYILEYYIAYLCDYGGKFNGYVMPVCGMMITIGAYLLSESVIAWAVGGGITLVLLIVCLVSYRNADKNK